MNAYITLSDASAETVVNKSRFLGFVYRTADEDGVNARLKELKKRYYDATHICYAFYLNGSGVRRSCDDGEPSGTAGAPIAEVIKGGGYGDVLVAVVRYFGGVKLGTGGLKRAYCDCALKTVAAAKRITLTPAKIYKVRLDYNIYDAINEKLNINGCKTLGAEFNDKVLLTTAVTDEEYFLKLISAATGGKNPEYAGETYVEEYA